MTEESTLLDLLPRVLPKPGIQYIPSQFTLDFEHQGERYVFHTLTKQLCKTELPEHCRANEGFDDLIRAYFLVPKDKEESVFYQSVFSMMRAFHIRSSNVFVILPTLACNARCFYCYEAGMPQSTMSPETVEQTVRYLVQNKPKGKMRIQWFGGEPMLYPEIIDRICFGLKKAEVEFSSFAVSNGSLITPELIEKMTELWNLDYIQISMDGNEADYIVRKRYPIYHDYYHSVMETISRISEEGIRGSVRCNVDHNNVDHMGSFLEDLTVSVKHKDNVYLYYKPLFGKRRTENDVAVWERIIAFKPRIEAAGFKVAEHFDLAYDFQTFNCMADTGGVTILPDGSLNACEHIPKEGRFGDIWNGVTNEAARKEFTRMDHIREKCRTCTFLPLCTPFESCPTKNNSEHCREILERQVIDVLCKRLRKGKTEEGDQPFNC